MNIYHVHQPLPQSSLHLGVHPQREKSLTPGLSGEVGADIQPLHMHNNKRSSGGGGVVFPSQTSAEAVAVCTQIGQKMSLRNTPFPRGAAKLVREKAIKLERQTYCQKSKNTC